MKKCLTYYMHYLLLVMVFIIGGIFVTIGDRLLLNSELICDNLNVFKLFGYVFMIVTPFTLFFGADTVEKYYKVESVPASEFEFVEYSNMCVLKLKDINMAWTIRTYQKRALMQKLNKNENLEVVFFYNRKEERMRDQLRI